MAEVLYTGTEPTYAHPGDAGADLTADTDYVIGYGEVTTVHTGTSVALPNGCVGLVFPRSGFGTKHGLALANTVGVIDAGYRGEIILQLTLNRPGTLSVKAGERIAQLVVMPAFQADFHRVTTLPDSVRGAAGFGSTGN